MERFYLYRRTVVREKETAAGIEIAVYNAERQAWILAPEFLGRILGIGGDGLDRVTREVAGSIVAARNAETVK
jgi:hypothetical protein